MQGLWDVVKHRFPFLTASSEKKPSPKAACALVLSSLTFESAPCASLLASFMIPTDSVVVASSSGAAYLQFTAHETIVEHTVTSLEGEITGVVVSNASPDIYFASGMGITMKSASAHGSHTALTMSGHSDSCLCLDVSPDGLHLISGGRDAAVVLWSIHEGPVAYLIGHNDWVRFVKFFRCGPDAVRNRLFAYSASDDGTVVLWDPLLHQQLAAIDFEGRSIRCFECAVAFNLAAVACDGSKIFLIRVKESSGPFGEAVELQQHDDMPNPHRGTLTAAKFTPDAKWLLTSSDDETIAISSVEGKCVMWRCNALVSKRKCMSFMNTITSIAIAASQATHSSVLIVCACSSDGDVLLWVIDPRDGRDSYQRRSKLQIGGLLSVGIGIRGLDGHCPVKL